MLPLSAVSDTGRPAGQTAPRYRLGIDIGGTFTDIVLLGSHVPTLQAGKPTGHRAGVLLRRNA